MKRRHHPGIENEPHLRGAQHAVDPSEERARRLVADSPHDAESAMEHGVWDEPAISQSLAGNPPADAVTYRSWLEQHLQRQTMFGSWFWCVCIAAASGPLAVLGALLFQFDSGWGGFVLLTVVAPLTEEIMKISLVYWTAERRAFRFVSSTQLIVCAIMSAVVFASVENLFYLWGDVFNFQNGLTVWRWTVCVALHVSCSIIAAIGVAIMWRHSIRHRERPVLSTAAPWIIAAVLIHGVYNGTVSIIEILSG